MDFILQYVPLYIVTYCMEWVKTYFSETLYFAKLRIRLFF